MVNRPAFGRARPPTDRPAARIPHPAPPPKRHVPEHPIAGSQADSVSVDDEVRAWQETRARPSFPWRQFSLMASLCFGAASFVLPQSVNEVANWLLYALAAASLFGGLCGWRKKA